MSCKCRRVKFIEELKQQVALGSDTLQIMTTDLDEPFFSQRLLSWHEHINKRTLPWKGEKDPYRIWLSEIILQQTRAEQGMPYYLKFVNAYPTVADLAAAIDEDVFRLWQGLGYYSRCRNLLQTARQIVSEFAGEFPADYNRLLSLKGVGAYTAAAIASFAFDLPQAVVDGNVVRVVSRYLGIETEPNTTNGKKAFQAAASRLLAANQSAAYNQAIMDLGATVCTPANPLCSNCPVASNCYARQQGQTALFPTKTKKPTVRTRYFHYLLLKKGNQIWLKQRTEKDIWQQLFEPFLIEAAHKMDATELYASTEYQNAGFHNKPKLVGEFKQRLTHQLIHTRFFNLSIVDEPALPAVGNWVLENELVNYAFPKTLVAYFSELGYFRP